jgi:hypothetical protein
MRLYLGGFVECLIKNWQQIAWTILALYLMALFIITAHELGHAVAVLANGGTVLGLEVHWLSLSGVTYYTWDTANLWLVDAAGMIVTFLISLMAYARKDDLMLYMAGLTSLNSTVAIATSDAAMMYGVNAPYAWAALGALAFLSTYILMRRFCEKFGDEENGVLNEALPIVAAFAVMAIVQLANKLLGF